MKTKTVDNSEFPERKVIKATKTPLGSHSRMTFGVRWTLQLTCGHIAGDKKVAHSESVRCHKCFDEGRK